METWWKQISKIDVQEQEMLKRQQQLLRKIWRAVLIVGSLAIAAALYLDYSSWYKDGQLGSITSAVVYLCVLVWLVVMQLWKDAPYKLQAYSLLIITYGVGLMLIYRYGMEGDGRIFLLLVPFIALVFLDREAGLFTFWASVIAIAIFAVIWTLGILPPPFHRAYEVVSSAGWISSGITWLLSSVFVYLTLQALLGWFSDDLATSRQQAISLENERAQMVRLVAQTKYQAALLEKSVALMQRLLSLRRHEELGHVLVSELAAEWHLEKVRLFLLNPRGKVLTMLSEAGENDGKHFQDVSQLMVGGDSLPGQVAFDRRERVLTWDAGENPEYPDGYVEVSFPLVVRGDMLGVLDIHSLRPSFSEIDMQMFRIIAGYIATSLDMVRLWEASESQIQGLRALYSRHVEGAWESLLEAESVHEFITGDIPVELIDELVREASRTKNAASALLQDGSQYALVIPIIARGVTVGYLGFTRPAEQGNWPQTTISLVEVAAERLGIILDNIRLLSESRRQAFYEERLGHIGDVVWSNLSVDAIMQQSVRELGRLLEANEVTLFISDSKSERS